MRTFKKKGRLRYSLKTNMTLNEFLLQYGVHLDECCSDAEQLGEKRLIFEYEYYPEFEYPIQETRLEGDKIYIKCLSKNKKVYEGLM